MVPFPHVALLVCAIFKEIIQVNKRFMFALGSFWRMFSLLFKRSFHVPHVRPILTTHGKILQPLIFVDV
jgi:hypothetical protein